MAFSAGPGLARADLGRDYGDAIKYLNKKDYVRAESKIRDALGQNNQAQDKILLSGSNRVPYVPYYVLGEALRGQGDCKGAVEAWQESLRQGQIQKLAKEYAALQVGMNACSGLLGEGAERIAQEPAPQPEKRPEPVPEPPPAEVPDSAALARPVEQAISDLLAANSRYSLLAQDPDLAAEWSANWKTALDSAQSRAVEFRQRLDTAMTANDAAAIEAIGQETEAVLSGIRSNQSRAEDRISSLRRAKTERLAQEKEAGLKRQQAEEEQRRLAAQQEREAAKKRQDELRQREQVASAQQALRSELEKVPAILEESGGDEPVRVARAQLGKQAALARAQLASNSLVEIEQLTRAIRDDFRRYNQAVQEWDARQREIAQRKPPPELRQIATAYFSGNYAAALQMADPEKFTEQRQQIQAYLFRSAALFNLYWLSGGTSAALLDRARSDVNEIKKLNRNFTPYVAAFSPKYIEFFRQ